MSKYVSRPRFFIYEDFQVKEVTENEYYVWSSKNWHPGHLQHAVVEESRDEVILGFQGHYKYCEWRGKPFNVTYFIYGTEIQWQEVIEEYFDTIEEAQLRFDTLRKAGQAIEQLQAA